MSQIQGSLPGAAQVVRASECGPEAASGNNSLTQIEMTIGRGLSYNRLPWVRRS